MFGLDSAVGHPDLPPTYHLEQTKNLFWGHLFYTDNIKMQFILFAV